MYTQSHVDYVIEAVVKLHRQRASLPAYRFESQTRFLRHFTASFARVGEQSTSAGGVAPAAT